MKQRYCELTHDLCLRAAFACYERKWHRPDFRALMWKYGGVSDPELRQDEEQQAVNAKLEAMEGIAYEMEQRVLDLLDGFPRRAGASAGGQAQGGRRQDDQPLHAHGGDGRIQETRRKDTALCLTHKLTWTTAPIR